jgi:hypothetical protein
LNGPAPSPCTVIGFPACTVTKFYRGSEFPGNENPHQDSAHHLAFKYPTGVRGCETPALHLKSARSAPYRFGGAGQGARRERLNALPDRLADRRYLSGILTAINPHSAMFRAMGSADFVHPLRGYAHGIAAALALAFGLEQARPLLLGLIRWPVVAASIYVQSGVGQGTQAFGQLDEARPQKLIRQGVAHLAFEPYPDCRVPIQLPMTGIDGQHDMNQLMHQHAEHLDGIGNIGANNDFKVAIIGGGRMPAFANPCTAPPR